MDSNTNSISDNEEEPLLNRRNNVQHRYDVLPPPEPGLEYTLYKLRWFILAVVMLLNTSNGMIWVTFSPVADLTGDYFNITASEVNWLSLTYPIATIPFGFVATFLLDTVGLRAGILLAACLNGLGAVSRVVSTVDDLHVNRYILLMIGQSLCAVAQPFILFTPTKVAALWFPDSQRATANMLGSMANPIGILLANALSPVVMNDMSNRMQLLLVIYLIPAGVGLLLAIFGVHRSVPPTAPSSSAGTESQPFFTGFKQILTNKNYLLLAFCQGCGVALFTSLTTLLQQMLCPWGYTDSFAGLCGALIIGVGVIGAGIAGAIVDKTKKFEEVAKISLCLATVCLAIFTIVSSLQHANVTIAIVLSCFGLFGFAMYPVAMELAVECTYPVAEATSSGMLLLIGQILSILLILIMQVLAKPLSLDSSQVCSPEQPMNYLYASFLLAALATFSSVIFVAFFKCDYRRLASEQIEAAERILDQHNQPAMA